MSQGRRPGQPHRVRPPEILGGRRVTEADELVPAGVLLVAGVGELTDDDLGGEAVRMVVDGRVPDAVRRIPDVQSVLPLLVKARPSSPMSCILQGKSSACRRIVKTGALLGVSLIESSSHNRWASCPPQITTL